MCSFGNSEISMNFEKSAGSFLLSHTRSVIACIFFRALVALGDPFSHSCVRVEPLCGTVAPLGFEFGVKCVDLCFEWSAGCKEVTLNSLLLFLHLHFISVW